MVQFITRDKRHYTIDAKTSYWKLGFPESKTARETIAYLSDRGYHCRKNATKPVAVDAVGRYQRGLMSYEGLDVSELQSLCKARGLSSKATTAARLARALQKADDNATLRLLDLPPEIRNTIYELYFSDLPKIKSNFAQPPLTMASKQLRAEALPLFYGYATFVYTIEEGLIDEGSCRFSTFSDDARKLMKMPAVTLSQIRNFTLRWEWILDRIRSVRREYIETLAVHITQQNATGKAFYTTTSTSLELDLALRVTIRDLGFREDGFKLQRGHIDALAAAAEKKMRWS